MKDIKKGQTLVEVLVAVGVTTLLLVAMVAAVTRSLANAQFSKNKAQATKYVEEGLEVVRSKRDNAASWAVFLTTYPAGIKKLDSNLTFSDGCTQSNKMTNSIFARCIEFADESAEKRVITVTVYWSDGSGTHNTQASTYLTSWK